MMARSLRRAQPCNRAQALERLAQAKSSLGAVHLVGGDESFAGVAAALAVLSGIAASDGACCGHLGGTPHGQRHRGAVALLATVERETHR